MKNILALLLLCTVFLSKAQKVTIEWSPEVETDNKVRLGDVIHATEDDYYITKIKRGGGWFGARYDLESIDKYSRDFKTIFSKSMVVLSEQDYLLDDVRYAKNKFLMFLHKYDKKAKATTYYTVTFDLKGNLKLPPTQLARYDENSKMGKDVYEDIIPSRDTSTFAFIVHKGYRGGIIKYAKGQKEQEAFDIAVLDNTGKKLWQKLIVLPSKQERELVVEDELVTNDGTVYLLALEYLENDKGKPQETIKDAAGNKIPGYIYKLFAVSNKGTTIKPYNIDLDKNYINSANLLASKDGSVVVTGFFNDEKGRVLKGLFYFEVDTVNQVVKKSNKEFEPSFIEQFKANKLTSKKGGERSISAYFSVNETLEREDGGKYLIAEYYRMVWVTVTTSSGTRSYPVYYYKDIIVTNIEKNGTITWSHRIGKNQVMKYRDKYVSYKAMVNNDKLFLLFNDDKDNAEEEEDDEKSDMMSNAKRSAAALQIIDKNGNVTKQNLFLNKEIETILDPRQCVIVNDHTLILVAENLKGKDLKIGRMVIQP